jgi:hypothetical protein
VSGPKSEYASARPQRSRKPSLKAVESQKHTDEADDDEEHDQPAAAPVKRTKSAGETAKQDGAADASAAGATSAATDAGMLSQRSVSRLSAVIFRI